MPSRRAGRKEVRVTDPEASIRVTVDPANPGHFLACCGLLEVADRLWPGAEGWFTPGEFRIACGGTLGGILRELVGAKYDEVLAVDNLVVEPLLAPLVLTLLTGEMTLDAWMAVRVVRGVPVVTANSPWNFWSGQQTPRRIWSALRAALEGQLPADEPEPAPARRGRQPAQPTRLREEQLPGLFGHRLMLSGRFGFDPGAAWNALDAGFSPNEQGMEVASSPAVELLAAVGLQRFRPRVGRDRETIVYHTWCRPLGPAAAACAAAGEVPAGLSAWRGRVISRGQYAALGYSVPIRGGSDE
jgi:CRISPR-associated protein Csx14